MFEGPEKKFQRHIAAYLVREHRYPVLEQADITDTAHFIAEDHLWALVTEGSPAKRVELDRPSKGIH